MLHVPSYVLPEKNIFQHRRNDWYGKIIQTVGKMLEAGSDYGITVRSISIDNPEKLDNSELKKTIYKILSIELVYSSEDEEATEQVINLQYDVPWLIDDHFFIGGNYKVAIYQLFDKPVIYKNNMIKIRTNVHSFLLERTFNKRSKYHLNISLFGKKVPFAKVVLSFLGIEETKRMFYIDSNNIPDQSIEQSKNIELLVSDIVKVLNNDSLDKDRLISTFFARKTDQEIIDNIKLVTKIDIFSKEYFFTNNVVTEYIYYLENGGFDDKNYDYKRLRFSEQVIYHLLCKDFYTMFTILKRSKRRVYNNNSKAIISNVNQSSITQFDFSINPLGELALLTRTSLSGPGGFEKTNVPAYLRDLHDSQLGIIDPADTADRDGCGTIQYLTPSVTINENGIMTKGIGDCINSIAVSHVPFLEHDDATRLQMASSQQRHSIMLKEFDVPMIQTGVEGMYTDNTSFIFRAQRNGEVIYKDVDIIIVQYDNKVCQAFNIGYRKLYLSVADFYNVYYEIGDKFNSNDIIAESNYLTNGRLTIGKNLLAAVMVYHGYNYEDGIVISDELVESDKFTSIHYIDLSFTIPTNKILENLGDDPTQYKPLPDIFDKLKKGDIYAKMRTVKSDGYHDVLFEPATELTSNEDCVITDIKMYANKSNRDYPQYAQYIDGFLDNQKNKKKDLINKLSSYLTVDKLENFLHTLEISHLEKSRNSYKLKGESVDGIRVEITAMYERKITIGDKIGNRHGNKGVISQIIPKDKMPTMPDGRKADVVINPLGIISRMNIGQLYELHLAMSLNDLREQIKDMHSKNKSKKEIDSYILNYIKIIDKTKDGNYYKQMVNILKSIELKDFMDNIDNFFIIQPPFESVKIDDLDKAMEYTHTEKEYTCFDPIQNIELQNKIAFGYQYFVKMNHIAQDKVGTRGVGPYANKTAQPLSGKSRKGGQRLGEMEIWALIGHGAEKNLKEFTTVKSDSIKLRNKYISEKMCNTAELLDSEDDAMSQSLRLLEYNLKIFGLEYPLNEGEE